MAEEVIQDPKPILEEQCAESHHCHGFSEKLKTCTTRVEGGNAGEETCVEEFFDFMDCVDHCVAGKLFPSLK